MIADITTDTHSLRAVRGDDGLYSLIGLDHRTDEQEIVAEGLTAHEAAEFLGDIRRDMADTGEARAHWDPSP